MQKQTVQTLKGFRDFLPNEKRARDFVQSKVVETFIRYGFEPVETPTLEYASLLLGKYGDEADKLVYSFTDRGEREVALRYDQTVPTARVLSQYQNELPKYFRRYQIQNVFRADKPQKGRFREFTQCDIDLFGSTDPIADAEILACSYESFRTVGFTEVLLKVNDRETLLATLSPFATDAVDVFSLIQSVDKLDKQTTSEVIAELVGKGISQINARELLEKIQSVTVSEKLQEILTIAESLGVPKSALVFSPTLARGLDYYTGMIFEIVVPAYNSGSCGGGGRYDNLIENLSGTVMPAVGVAFGFDRMVEAAKALKIIPTITGSTEYLVTVFSPQLRATAARIAKKLRSEGKSTQLYPSTGNIRKQLKYADRIGAKFAVIVGEEEVKNNAFILKNLENGDQVTVGFNLI
ncbi:MAG: histidine--tRNA ligase [Candidatus Pacebacteria bacterium]|nr:histidine--tRNA ligase [Candidatus Paceibacterota bacterium]PIR60006.1 MAG: histidine--tRNA ligase [Candidatus Pacebacteria bacterium CG10_big_fil_rev_8_21_14_0_10_44_54]